MKNELQKVVLARHPIIGIVTEDEAQTIDLVRNPEISQDSVLLFDDVASGLEVEISDEGLETIKEQAESLGKDLEEILEFVNNLLTLGVLKNLRTNKVSTLWTKSNL